MSTFTWGIIDTGGSALAFVNDIAHLSDHVEY